ncbi:MAG TPA: helix-turn-helix domain-containing protein [Thermoleophilaceae bacterium]|jgi:DNA-binding transcriptional ArsR family regulator
MDLVAVIKVGPGKEISLTKPVDITDPTVAKAYSHPLRIEILGLLDNRVASPRQLATELDAGLSVTSYHVRQLKGAKLIRLVRRKQVRGAIEHYYTANVRPTITDTGWGRLPPIVKRAWLGGKIALIGKEVAAAAGAGGFDHKDIHLSRTSVRVTPAAWNAAAKILARALDEIEALGVEGAAHPEAVEEEGEERHAIAVMMLFEAASPESFDPHTGAQSRTENFDDFASTDQHRK